MDGDKNTVPDNRLIFANPQAGADLERVANGMLPRSCTISDGESFGADIVGLGG